MSKLFFELKKISLILKLNFSVFDVICANKNSFYRTEEKNRRLMAKRFQQKVIEDARKAGSLYPTNIRKEFKILSYFLGDYFFVLDFCELLKVNPTTITPTRHGQSCPHYVSVQTILVYYETFKSHDTPPLSALFGIKPPNYPTLQNDF